MLINSNYMLRSCNYNLNALQMNQSRTPAFGRKKIFNLGTNYTVCLKPNKHDEDIDAVSEKKLFPNGITELKFQQGKMCSCATLATIKSLSLNKIGQKLLKKMINVKQDGSIQVIFPNHPRLNIKAGNIENLRKNYNAKGDLGAVCFEEAYKNLRKSTLKHNISLLTKNHNVLEKNVIYTGTKASSILKDFTGVKPANADFFMNTELNRFLDKFSENQDKFVAIAGTKKANFDVSTETDRNTKLKLLSYHAYSITDVDKEKQLITLIDPHNSEVQRKIDYEMFHKLFDQLSYVDMDKVAEKYSL